MPFFFIVPIINNTKKIINLINKIFFFPIGFPMMFSFNPIIKQTIKIIIIMLE
jgi:hypothetical protein